MYIRKIAAAAGFACGAALAFAPLAAADLGDTVTSTLGSEVASLNGVFQFDALLSGVPSTDYAPSGVGGLDTILLADVVKDAPQSGMPSTLDYLLYGADPFKAGVSSDSGSFSELNGALTQFDNAYNVEVYSMANGGTLDTNLGDYLYNGTIQNVLATPGETTTQAFDTLYNHAIGDLGGYFQTDLSAFDMTPATMDPGAAVPAADISSTVAGEISSANSMFESYASLTGLPTTDLVMSTGNFDTLATGVADSPQLDAFETAVFGFNPENVSPDPGAYDLLNGALVKFDDAFNFGLYALENGGAAIPAADFSTDLFGISGTAATELAGESATQAISSLFTDGLSDLAGYF